MNAKQEIIEHAPANAPWAQPVTSLNMIERAVQSGASIEIITKLMDLQERHEKNQARRAFDEAISLAKAEIKPITKNAKGHNEKRYANFAAYAKEVDPIIARHGLSYRFRTVQTDRISVTCILSHRAGHSEENTLSGPADTTGSKNAIQAIGSTLTYLSRYSLIQALGLAAADDDDGRQGGGAVSGTISDKQMEELQALIEESGTDIEKFVGLLGVDALADVEAKDFEGVKLILAQKAAIAKLKSAK